MLIFNPLFLLPLNHSCKKELSLAITTALHAQYPLYPTTQHFSQLPSPSSKIWDQFITAEGATGPHSVFARGVERGVFWMPLPSQSCQITKRPSCPSLCSAHFAFRSCYVYTVYLLMRSRSHLSRLFLLHEMVTFRSVLFFFISYVLLPSTPPCYLSLAVLSTVYNLLTLQTFGTQQLSRSWSCIAHPAPSGLD